MNTRCKSLKMINKNKRHWLSKKDKCKFIINCIFKWIDFLSKLIYVIVMLLQLLTWANSFDYWFLSFISNNILKEISMLIVYENSHQYDKYWWHNLYKPHGLYLMIKLVITSSRIYWSTSNYRILNVFAST